jgi:hypothetical protein
MVTWLLLLAAGLSRTVVHADTLVRANPGGAAVVAGAFHRRVLDRDEEEHVDAAYVQAGVGLTLTPAYAQPGVHVEASPAPFAILRVEGSALRFSGFAQGLLRFDSATAPFGGGVLSARAGEEQAAWGARLATTLTLRARVGALIPRLEASVAAYRFDDRGPFLYESEYDTLLAQKDALVCVRALGLVRAWHAGEDAVLLAGPAVEVVRTVETRLARTRVGAVGYFVPVDAWGALRRPRVFALGGVDAVDRNRAGTPYALLGIGADFE